MRRTVIYEAIARQMSVPVFIVRGVVFWLN